MNNMDPADAEILQKMMEEGLLDKAAGRYRLTPKAINAMQRRALMEIFAHLPRGARESHATTNPGAGAERLEGTKKYQFGDPISELDLNATLRNAIARVKSEPQAGLPIADRPIAEWWEGIACAPSRHPGIRWVASGGGVRRRLRCTS